jgi:AraC-like DNA-binding protein
MGFQLATPSNNLAPFVKSYWGMDHSFSPGKECLQRIVPSGLSELIIYLGDLPESMDPGKSITAHSLLSGQLKEYYDLKVSGHLSLFSIIFQPHGLMAFFDLPLRELFNQAVPLRFILKDVVGELEDRLFESSTFESRIEIVEDFLLKRIRKSRKTYEFERIRCSIEVINRARGVVDIETLSSTACLSRKQFERTFLEHVGTTPKQFLKTVRFQNAIHEKSKNQDLSLTELTYQCGYYDQAHMTGDFQKLAGKTPSRYFAESEPYSDYFGNGE